MAGHRLPGVSIDSNDWNAISELAASLDMTRSDVIRIAIKQFVEPRYDLARELADAHQQLVAIKATLARSVETATAVAA